MIYLYDRHLYVQNSLLSPHNILEMSIRKEIMGKIEQLPQYNTYTVYMIVAFLWYNKDMEIVFVKITPLFVFEGMRQADFEEHKVKIPHIMPM